MQDLLVSDRIDEVDYSVLLLIYQSIDAVNTLEEGSVHIFALVQAVVCIQAQVVRIQFEEGVNQGKFF